jgi:hypothetical protein
MTETDRDKQRDEEEAESRLKVTDRRLFTLDGDLRENALDEQEQQGRQEPEEPTEAESREVDAEAGASGFEHRPVEEPSGVDFTMLLNAMAQPALLFLGEIAHPSTGQPKIDLEQARIQIDMLELLRVKCRGNLSPDEDGLLDRMLYELRMLYVARSS